MPASPGLHRNLSQTPWARPVSFPAFPEAGEVHLWRAGLSPGSTQTAKNYAFLSPDEQQRAAKFHYPKDRDHFINARGILRCLLGQYLGLSAAAISFTYSEYGKPDLAMKTSLNFNVSHADGYGLFGFSSGAPIGVDLEKTDESIEVERLVSRFFSPTEAAAVLTLSPAERHAAFFRTWTRKEAFIKAHGEGLGLPLDQFSVSVALEEPVVIKRIDWAPEAIIDWELSAFMVQRALPGAVALEGLLLKCCFFDW